MRKTVMLKGLAMAQTQNTSPKSKPWAKVWGSSPSPSPSTSLNPIPSYSPSVNFKGPF